MYHSYILQIPSYYPTIENPISGIFFKEQANLISSIGLNIKVITNEGRGLSRLSFNLIKKNYFQVSRGREENLTVTRLHGWNIIPISHHYDFGHKIWAHQLERLCTKEIVVSTKPSLIHAHNSIGAGVVARRLKKKFGIPYIVTEHASTFSESIFSTKDIELIKEIYDDSDKIIAVSDAFRKIILSTVGNVYDSKIEVIPNFVDADFFLPGSPKSIDNIGIGNFTFLTISNLVPIKRVERLIKAFGAFIKNNTTLYSPVLKIGGDGYLKEELQHLVHNLNLSEHIIFLGKLSRAQVKTELESASAFVLGSEAETFGIVLIEAMMMGKPILSTKSGGAESIIQSDQVGILVDKNEDSLSKGFLQMLVKFSSYNPRVIRQFAVDKFSQYGPGTKYFNIYKSYENN